MLYRLLGTFVLFFIVPYSISAQEYRLPSNVHSPKSYNLELDVGANVFSGVITNKFTGKVTSVIETLKSASNITLHSSYEYISISRLTVNNTVYNYTVNSVTDILTIDYPSQEGDILELVIDYNGVLADDMYGFYRSSYVHDGTTKYLVSTQFQATYARRAFPCFDEPEYKAYFTVTITYPTNLNALSNTNGVNLNMTQYLKTTFTQTPKMSTYLLAFIVSEFDCTESVSDLIDVKHRICSRTDLEASGRDWSVEISPKLLAQLNDYTDIQYSLSIGKVDQVAIPDFSAGAMENWGLITYRENNLLWTEGESSNRYKQSIATVIAHELTHMWFGNLVTTRWWDTTFLNEGFARLFQYIIVGLALPEWEMSEQFIIEHHQAALAADETASSQPLKQSVSTPSEVSGRFGTISYSKGAAILRMVQNTIGAINFQGGLRGYLKSRALNYTEPEMLWEALENGNGRAVVLPDTLTNIMKNWVDENGFPIITVTQSGNSITLTQEKFVENSTSTTKFYVPITYQTPTGTGSIWLLPNQTSINITVPEDDWVLLNYLVQGYYRVNYSSALWHKLAHFLLSEDGTQISATARSQIVDDLFFLAAKQKLTYSNVFHYLEFLQQETSYYPWYAAFTGFNRLLRRLGVEGDVSKSLLNQIESWMAPVYASAQTGNASLQVYTHKHVLTTSWACKLGTKSCLDMATVEFNKYKETGVRPEPNTRSTVYCYHLKHSTNSSDWEFLYEAYKETNIPTEKTTILSALGCPENSTLLERYLNYSINLGYSGIRSQDASSVFSSVYTNPKGVDIALQFLIKNYTQIETSYKNLNALSKLITGIADYFTTTQQIELCQQFVNGLNSTYDSFKSTANSALKSATTNLESAEKVRSQLKEYYEGLDGNGDGHAATLPILTISFVLLLSTIVLVF